MCCRSSTTSSGLRCIYFPRIMCGTTQNRHEKAQPIEVLKLATCGNIVSRSLSGADVHTQK
ncbi:MAG: hypothetical protein ACUVQ6_03095 [Dissulfurimicrobium sp.]|uniref:hypothetical protein n=1 Tax=Dissulfurimicrobium sp. TaxID=2022436 RepID=UPI00404ACB84